jgi:hypothetical protein
MLRPCTAGRTRSSKKCQSLPKMSETFHFKSHYPMTAHGYVENGLSWADGGIDYDTLRKTIYEAVSGYAHLYAYGVAKTKFLTTLLAQPVRNLEDLKCPPPHGLEAQFSCSMPCHKNYQNYSCQHETRIQYSNGSSITFTTAPISTVHPNLHAIPPRLIRVYHSCNDVIFFFFYSCIKRR